MSRRIKIIYSEETISKTLAQGAKIRGRERLIDYPRGIVAASLARDDIIPVGGTFHFY